MGWISSSCGFGFVVSFLFCFVCYLPLSQLITQLLASYFLIAILHFFLSTLLPLPSPPTPHPHAYPYFTYVSFSGFSDEQCLSSLSSELILFFK